LPLIRPPGARARSFVISGVVHALVLLPLLAVERPPDDGVRGQVLSVQLVRADGGVPGAPPVEEPTVEPVPSTVDAPHEPQVAPSPVTTRPRRATPAAPEEPTFDLPRVDELAERSVVDALAEAGIVDERSTTERLLDSLQDPGPLAFRSGGGAPPAAEREGAGSPDASGVDPTSLAVWKVRVQSHLMRIFEPPGGEPSRSTRVQLFIRPDGTITGSQLVTSSGRDDWDEAALRAIEEAAWVPAPPAQAFALLEDGFDVRFEPR